MLTPETIDFYRVAIGEATRFPDLFRHYYRTGPAEVPRMLSRRLAALRDEGRLIVDDPDRVSRLFIFMVLGDYQRRLAMGLATPPSPEKALIHTTRVAEFLLRALDARSA